MTCIEDREFEPLVREAMQSRPQPSSISNLAYRAIELARQQARILARRQLEGLIRLRRRARWIGALAAALIAIVVAVGVTHLSDSAAPLTAITASTDGSSVDSTTSWLGSATVGIGLVAELILVVLILLSTDPGCAPPQAETLV